LKQSGTKGNERGFCSFVAAELVSLEQDSTENYTLKWQNGLISNFDYLMYLNSMADRTINDITQYENWQKI